MTPPYGDYRDTPLWKALAVALRELQATRELSIATDPDYVIGYLCQELAARDIVSRTALSRGDAR